MTRFRVLAPRVELRVSGVLTTHFYGEVFEVPNATDAARLVAAGEVTPVPPEVPR